MAYRDEHGRELSLEELRKILKASSHPQYRWWKHNPSRVVVEGSPPKGVRQHLTISTMKAIANGKDKKGKRR